MVGTSCRRILVSPRTAAVPADTPTLMTGAFFASFMVSFKGATLFFLHDR